MPENKVVAKSDLLRRQVMSFLKEVREKTTSTKARRLEIEIERFQKAMQLDELLEKAEMEKNPKKAIDYYLEALAFIIKNNFELNRKGEIKEKIRALQETKVQHTYSHHGEDSI
ncbi:hypothetical protein J7J59_02075 [Candidatus Aerophobetes bacterium]|nr:hypothetical protein [Candidatus Aerophobetes bacterium]